MQLPSRLVHDILTQVIERCDEPQLIHVVQTIVNDLVRKIGMKTGSTKHTGGNVSMEYGISYN